MRKLPAYLLATALPILAATQVSATMYDNFSEPVLNSSRWTEYVPKITTLENERELDKHYVNTMEEVWHTAQTIPSALKEISIISTTSANIDEKVSFDIDYKFGTSNRRSDILVNHNIIGSIGSWNGNTLEFGNEFGNYLVEMIFSKGEVDLAVTDPSGITTYSTSEIYGETTFGARTAAEQGRCEFNYDNFKIAQIPETSTLGLTALAAAGLTFCRKRNSSIEDKI